MADIEYLDGTDGNDILNGGDGENVYTGGRGDDQISGIDGVNTVNFAAGDGVDSVSFAPPRTYQYADFLLEVERVLADPTSFSGTVFSNEYFGDDASRVLIDSLPSEIRDVLRGLRYRRSGEDGSPIPGLVDSAAAETALRALRDWINAPTSIVVQFGADISASDIELQMGRSASFGAPYEFAVAVDGKEGMIFTLGTPEIIAGDASVPPVYSIEFRFADGSSITAAELLAGTPEGVMGSQFDGDDGAFLHGSIASDQIYGNGGDDQIDAGPGYDTVFGGSGNDAISGGAHDDTLYGEDGDDVIAAGAGMNMASGGSGNDTYAFNRGDGVLGIDNMGAAGDTDTLSFGKDVDPSQVMAFVDPGSGVLTLMIADTGDMVTVPWFDPWSDNAERPDQVIHRVQFIDADGNARVFDFAALVLASKDALMSASYDAPLALFGAGAAAYELAGTEVAGGEYAQNYALTGDLFTGPGSGDVNDAPVAGAPVGKQTTREDEAFSFTVPSSAFSDADGDVLTFTAMRADGAPLPSWLAFDEATRTFSGTPGNAEVGTVSVQVIATDPDGASAAQTFDIEVENVNDAPVATVAAASAGATEDTAFSYVVPAGLFTDQDAGDTLTLSATRADGSPLPAWLSFDPATRTLSGMPGNGDVGAVTVKITATDGAASASSLLNLFVTNVNDTPTVGAALAHASANEDAPFAMTLPVGAFSDMDAGDTLTLSATMADGSALPAWLHFNPGTRTFSGMPGNAEVGSYGVEVKARDGSGAYATQTFTLTVNNVNDTPVLSTALADQSVNEGATMSFTLPAGAFTDVDAGDHLTLTARMEDGSTLPSWLAFNHATRTFTASPAMGLVGAFDVRVTATDTAGASVWDVFTVNVGNVNEAPTVANAVANQTAAEDAPFAFTLPADTFADADAGDTLTLSATLADGRALPAWLSFNRVTRTFSGTPRNGDVGGVSVRVTATDSGGLTASDEFYVGVTNVNDAPELMAPLADQRAVAGEMFRAALPDTAFRDPDAGDTLVWSAKLGGGADLPSWLTFDPGTRTFQGVPPAVTLGRMDLRVTVTDTGSMSASDMFTLEIVGGTTEEEYLRGGSDDDTLEGGEGADDLKGRGGRDLLYGYGGDDELRMSRDGTWGRSTYRRHEGSPGWSGTGERVSIARLNASYDRYDGGAGYDTLFGTSSGDAILLDDDRSPVRGTGPRFVGVERFVTGSGNDVVDLTSQRYAYGDVTVEAGEGRDVVWTSSGNDVLHGGGREDRMHGGLGNDYLDGGSRDDILRGGAGIDILQGGSGDDDLRDTSGQGVMAGGNGDDTIVNGGSSALLVGGHGDDRIVLGGGNDVVLFNKGDDRDTLIGGRGGNATVSLGAGIRLSDLALRQVGDDLVLEVNGRDSITFDDWYDGTRFQSVSKLQFVAEKMPGYNGSSKLLDDKVETFDFRGLVARFDAARAATRGLSKWALTAALTTFHLSGSDEAALGGDLAYHYGVNDTLAGVSVAAAQGVAGSTDFGRRAQTLHSSDEVTAGAVKLA